MTAAVPVPGAVVTGEGGWVHPVPASAAQITRIITRERGKCMDMNHRGRDKKKYWISAGVLFLFPGGSLNTVIGLLQAKDRSDRAGRADAPLLLKDTVSTFPGHTEQEFIAHPHAFGVRGAGFTDTLLLIFIYDFFPIIIRHAHLH